MNMNHRIIIELVTAVTIPNQYRLTLVVGNEVKLLGTIEDRGGWAVGTMTHRAGEWDANKVEDVVTAMLTEEVGTLSHMLVEWGKS
jgi:hypothetical protein